MSEVFFRRSFVERNFGERYNHNVNNVENNEVKMSKVVASTFGNFSDDELDKLNKAVRELSDVYSMQEAQRETAKEIINAVFEELKIPKSIVRKIARAYHKRNYDAVVAENAQYAVFSINLSKLCARDISFVPKLINNTAESGSDFVGSLF